MDSLQISSGAKRIQITDEKDKEKGILEFNPSSMSFIEGYQNLLINFSEKSKEADKLLEHIREMEAENTPDEDVEKVRELSGKAIKNLDELYDFVEKEIDILFGNGSSSMLFSEERDVDEYHQFLNGIGPHIQSARAEKVEKYAANKVSKKASARTKAG